MFSSKRPAFSEEFEKAEEELQKLFGEYFIHVRCLDALRAQMNANSKIAQTISDPINKSSAPPSMILPGIDGIVDFSDDLSNDDDDYIDDDDLKLKRTIDSIRDVPDGKMEKNETDPGKSKLRIKTGGNSFCFPFTGAFKLQLKVNYHFILVGKTDDNRLIGRMLSEEGDSDLDSSLQYNHDDDSDTESQLNPENLLDESVANVEALYNFSENVPVRKNYQSDEDF